MASDSHESSGGSKASGSLDAEEARYRQVQSCTPGSAQAVPALVAHLGDSSWRVRKAAVARLARFRGEPTLVPALVSGLASGENAGLRNACSAALVELGTEAFEELARALGTEDPSHRRFIVEALGRLGGADARDALVPCLEDRDENVRAAAAEALGRIGGEKATAPLRTHLGANETDLMQRVYLLDALARAEARLSFEDLEPWIGRPILARHVNALLGLTGDPRSIAPLVSSVLALSEKISDAAVFALARLLPDLGPDGIAQLRRALVAEEGIAKRLLVMLEHPVDEIVGATVELLAVVGDPSVAPEILRACSSRTIVDVGGAAVFGMGSAAVAPLQEAFDAADTESQVVFLEVLELIADPSIVPGLLEIARGPDTRVAEAALRLVGVMGGADAIKPLMDCARVDDKELARTAGVALAALSERLPDEVATAVAHALSGGEARPAWLFVLGALGRPEDAELVLAATHHDDPNTRRAAVEAGVFFEESLPVARLVFCLADEEPDVRVAAARALGSVDAPEARDALLAACKDRDPWVVAAAIRSLGTSLDPKAATVLISAAGSTASPIAIAALQSLFRLNPPGVASAVEKAIHHADPEVVREAVALSMRLSEESAQRLLAQCLTHRAWSVRGGAAECIANRGLNVSSALVRDCLEKEEDPLVTQSLQRLLDAGEETA